MKSIATEVRAEPTTARFLGLEFTRLNPDDIMTRVGELARASRFSYVVTPNVDHIIKIAAAEDSPGDVGLQAAYANAALTICDSRILLALASRSGIPITLLPGSDLTRILLEERIPNGSTVALIGGIPAQLQALAKLRPDVQFCQHRPPMGVMHNIAAQDAIAEFVESRGCDFNLFTIGAPQSEIVAHRVALRGRARGVGLCVGASVEFITGDKRRAPRWVQRASLEWAYRLGSEPRRLWRRYLVDGPRIFAIWWRQR